jgi:hypothetical protein
MRDQILNLYYILSLSNYLSHVQDMKCDADLIMHIL